MPRFSQAQTLKRLHTLPQDLREVLFSVYAADVIGDIKKTHHLSDEKGSGVARIAGGVLLGFIHSGDVARTINEELGIARDAARSIADELDEKVFSSHQETLEKIYSPPQEEEIEEEAETPAGPQIVDLRESEEAKAASAPAPLPHGEEKEREGGESTTPFARAMAEKKAEEQEKTKQTPPKKTSVSTSAAPAPFPSTKKEKAPTPKTPPVKAEDDTPPTSKAPTPPKPQTPFVIHEGEEAQAISKKRPGFRFSLGKDLFRKPEASDDKAPTPTARLEIGKKEKEAQSGVSRGGDITPRTVHYNTSRRTPISRDGVPMPTPPAPAAPTPPKPPQKDTATQNMGGKKPGDEDTIDLGSLG